MSTDLRRVNFRMLSANRERLHRKTRRRQRLARFVITLIAVCVFAFVVLLRTDAPLWVLFGR